MKKITKLNLFAIILLLPVSVWAAMSSTNYYIYADSVETGGGLSSGGVYSLEDTLGEGIISQTTGTTYIINAGYQAMVLGSLSMNISTTTISFGDLSTTSVKSVDTTITVTTDAGSGYSMSVQSANWAGVLPENVLTDVSDGTVDVGQEEYGVAVSGPDAAFGNDRSYTTGRVLASKNSPALGSQTIITFKAAISPTTLAGPRSQTSAIGVSANF